MTLKIAIDWSIAAAIASAKVRFRKNAKSMIGSRAQLSSQRTNAAKSGGASRSPSRVAGSVHVLSSPHVTPTKSEVSPAVKRAAAGRSNDSPAETERSDALRVRYAQRVPNTPTGMLIRKMTRQLVRAMMAAPRMIPRTDPTPQMTAVEPNARPRSPAGKASERMANEFAVRRAAPTPWIARNPTSSTPLGARPQSAEPTVKTMNPVLYIRLRP